MRVRLEKDGATISLDGQPIARGGEAGIYAIADRSGFLAKVYHHAAPEHADKLAAMIAAPPDDPTAKQGHASIAWPTDRLFDADAPDRCVGFVMPHVEKAHSLFDAYNPKSRLQTWPLFHYGYLLRTARNLAIAVRALHARGYVLGDLNESNVLVNGQALVTVVDVDSFQVRAAARVFRCTVGKPEFVAPEIQGKDFAEIDRTPEQDAFALAVLIFQLLMQGTHPFAGRFTGAGEQEVLAKRIAAGHFPYARERRGPYEPNPTAPPFVVVPPQVRDLMRLCFEEGHDRPAARPDAGRWQKALAEADAQLGECVLNPQHRFHKSLDACPWCELALKQGRDPFPSKEKIQSGVDKSGSQKPVPPPSGSKPAAAPAPSAPKPAASSRPPRRRARPWKRVAGLIPSFLLTPWPWVIGLGLTGIVVLVVMIVKNAHQPLATPVAAARPSARPIGDPVSPDLPDRAGDPPGKADDGGPTDNTPPGDDHKPDGDRPPAPIDAGPPPDWPIGEVREMQGHTGRVAAVAMSRDGHRALSGGADGEVFVWNLRAGKQVLGMTANTEAVLCVAMTGDGRYGLSGGRDNEAHLWDLETGKELHTLKGHTDAVRCAAFAPHGRRAVTGGDDGTVRLWDVQSGKVKQTWTAHDGWVQGAAFSPDGDRIASCGSDGTVRLWNAASGEPIQSLAGHAGAVYGVAFSPKGDWLASCGTDGTLRLWDAVSGRALHTYQGGGGAVHGVAFTPDGTGLLWGGDDGAVHLWDAANGVEVCKFTTRANQVASVAPGAGRLAVSGDDDDMVRLWSLPDAKASPEQIAARTPVPPPTESGSSGNTAAPRLSAPPKEAPIVAAPPAPDGLLHSFDSHNDVVTCVAMAPDGKQLVTGCQDGQVYLWDVEKGESTICNGGHAGAVRCVAFSPDGRQFASGGLDQIARLWDARDGSLQQTFAGHIDAVLCLAFTASKTLITGAASGDADLNFPDVRSDGMFRQWMTLPGAAAEIPVSRDFFGPPYPVTCMAFSASGPSVLFLGSDPVSGGAYLVLWNRTTGKTIRKLKGDDVGSIVSIAVSQNGSRGATTGPNGDVRLWNLNVGRQELKLEGLTDTIWCAAFSPDGDRLLTGGDDGTVRLWEATTGKELRDFTGHAGPVRCVAFSRDGKRAVSGGDDRTARVWDLAK